MPQIQKLSIKHEAIMNYMLANPGIAKGDVAREFGISQAWLSIIIYSDAFQSQLREKQKEMFDETVIATVRDKITAVAHQGLEKMLDQVSGSEAISHRDLRDTTSMALNALGFGTSPGAKAPQSPGTVNNVQINVDVGTLKDARALIGAIPAGLLPGSSALIPGAAVQAQPGYEGEESSGEPLRAEGP